MAYPKLQALAAKSEKAANEMVAEIARGVHAGNECITSQAAAKSALETAEEILVQLEPGPAAVPTNYIPDQAFGHCDGDDE